MTNGKKAIIKRDNLNYKLRQKPITLKSRPINKKSPPVERTRFRIFRQVIFYLQLFSLPFPFAELVLSGQWKLVRQPLNHSSVQLAFSPLP